MAFAVAVGDRIAQLVLEKILTPPVLEVDVSVSIPGSFFLSTDAIPELGRHHPGHQWVWLDWWSHQSLIQLVFLFVSIPIYELKSVRDSESGLYFLEERGSNVSRVTKPQSCICCLRCC